MDYEFNLKEIESTLRKANIELADKDGRYKTFGNVILELTRIWGILSNDYRNEVYTVLGIQPDEKVEIPYIPNYPIMRDSGIEYLKNQPTCE